MKKDKLKRQKQTFNALKKEMNNLTTYIDKSETALHQQIRELRAENQELEEREKAWIANINTFETFKQKEMG